MKKTVLVLAAVAALMSATACTDKHDPVATSTATELATDGSVVTTTATTEADD